MSRSRPSRAEPGQFGWNRAKDHGKSSEPRPEASSWDPTRSSPPGSTTRTTCLGLASAKGARKTPRRCRWFLVWQSPQDLETDFGWFQEGKKGGTPEFILRVHSQRRHLNGCGISAGEHRGEIVLTTCRLCFQVPSPFFPGNHQKPRGNSRFLKRTMVEKNGESTHRDLFPTCWF